MPKECCENFRTSHFTFRVHIFLDYSLHPQMTVISVLLDKHHNCASTEVSVRQGNLIYYKLKDNKTKARPSLEKNKLF